MAFDADDEILQDFLVEATEILEQLGSQLLDLEQSPLDSDLLNAVFRGFHTIKGGASFLSLTNLVEICHAAEDVFNLLRSGERHADADMMDTFLRVLDVLNEMFSELRAGQEPSPAPPELIGQLKAILAGESPTPAPAPAASPAPSAPAPAEQGAGGDQDITDEEFEQLLDALEEPEGQPAAQEAGGGADAGEEITEDEFEQLLDKLHGKGKHVGAPPGAAAADQPAAAGEEITEDEFEKLLDELHGKGKHGGLPQGGQSADVQPAAAAPEPPAAAPEPPAAAPEPPAAAPEPPPTAPAPPPAQPQVHVQAQGGGAAAVAVAEPPPQAAVQEPEKQAAKEKDAAAQGETTVRVDTKRLDDIMNMVGELVLVRNRLVTLESASGNEEITHAISNLDLVTADLQSAVMKTRMQPIKKVFGRFPRVVRDLARSLKKEVNLEMQGEDTDLDKNLVEALADPLVHLVRNAVDHGIEMPEEREAAGKPRAGTVILAAEQEGDHILLTITDDGKGMDPHMLRAKAVEKGIMEAEAAARLDDHDAFNLIFAPGFSTKAEISDISGRGVGMDVVKTRIVQLNGSVEIESEKGKGSRLIIKVPLTLAIMPTLMVMLGDQIFALPLVSVSEIFNLDLTHTNTVDGQLVIMVRDRPLPLYFLKQWLVRGAQSQPRSDEGHVVVVNVGNQRVGFVVEQLIGQEEVVIKPLGALLQGLSGLAGATITGDGRIALILDVPSLMKAYARRMS